MSPLTQIAIILLLIVIFSVLLNIDHNLVYLGRFIETNELRKRYTDATDTNDEEETQK
jgi:hypothetical protein